MDERDRQFRREMWRDMDSGWTMTAELLTATAVWMGIGWLLDRWLGTDPWIMLGGALLGFALGTYVTFLRADARGKAEESRRRSL